MTQKNTNQKNELNRVIQRTPQQLKAEQRGDGQKEMKRKPDAFKYETNK